MDQSYGEGRMVKIPSLRFTYSYMWVLVTAFVVYARGAKSGKSYLFFCTRPTAVLNVDPRTSVFGTKYE